MPLLPFNKAPDVDAIQRKQLERVEEIEKAKEEGSSGAQALKMKHIDEMLQALEEGGESAFFGMKADDGILPPKDEAINSEYDEILYRMPSDKKKGPKYYADLGLTPEEVSELSPIEEGDLPPTADQSSWKPLAEDAGTMRPKGASTADKLLSKCAFYYKLSTK